MRSRSIGITVATICLCLVMAGGLSAGENIWTTKGPFGGSIETIAIHPYNPHILLIGTIQNGVYKSTNGGEYWTHIDETDMDDNMRVVAFNPVWPDTVYATTAFAMYKSLNGGLDWYRLSAPVYHEYRAFAIDPLFTNILFGDELKSTDSGDTWTRGGPWNNRQALTIDQLNPNNIYFASGMIEDGSAVFKSGDLGETWENISHNITGTGFGNDIAVSSLNDSVLYFSSYSFVGVGTCLWKSTNGGDSWVDVTPPGLTDTGINCISLSLYDPNAVFTGSEEDGVCLSTDQGQSWEFKNEGLKILNIARMAQASAQVGILLGTYQGGFYKSLDNGEHWQWKSDSICLAECHDLTMDRYHPDTMYTAAINGLFRSENGGNGWSYVETGDSYRNSPYCVRVDDDIPANIYMANVGYESTAVNSLGFYISTDYGITWQFRSNALPHESFYNMRISYLDSTNRRIFLATWNQIFYSDDFGANWHLNPGILPNDIDINNLEVAPSDPNVLALADSRGYVFISRNRGASWDEATEIPLNNPYGETDIAFDPNNSEIIYVAFGYDALIKSINGGISWDRIENDLPIDPVNKFISGITVNPLNPNNLLVYSAHRGLYHSHNGGRNWERFINGFDTTCIVVYEIRFNPHDTTKMVIATSDHSVWTIHRTVTSVDGNEVSLPGKIGLTCYPNPFNAETKITFNLAGKSDASLTILDVMGKEIRRFIDLRGSDVSVIWDGTDAKSHKVASGTYFARLNCGEISKSIKMTLIK